jgi:hypothetical protein
MYHTPTISNIVTNKMTPHNDGRKNTNTRMDDDLLAEFNAAYTHHVNKQQQPIAQRGRAQRHGSASWFIVHRSVVRRNEKRAMTDGACKTIVESERQEPVTTTTVAATMEGKRGQIKEVKFVGPEKTGW